LYQIVENLNPLFVLAFPQKQDDTDWWILFFFLIWPMIIWVIHTTRAKYVDVELEREFFNARMEYSRDNLMEAYICLAARMIQTDLRESRDKVLYMNKYFQRHFPSSHYHFGESLSYAYRNPIELNRIGSWLKIKLPRKKQRIQVMYFLTGLSIVDGTITPSEYVVLDDLREFLGLTPKEFESILAMYRQNKKQSGTRTREVSIKIARKLSCEVLGVSDNASIDEIKKAYRKLVKLHHPDRFCNESKEQQKLAKERFITVQKAYEVLGNIR
jgi:DnaJ like chaperone protein